MFQIIAGLAGIICAVPIIIKFIHWLKAKGAKTSNKATQSNNHNEQTEPTSKPMVLLEIIENQAAGYRFQVKNVGPESAIDIKITENTVICRNNAYPLKENEEKMDNPKFNMPSSLCPGEEKLLTPLQKGEQDLWIIKKPGIINIEYRDLKNTTYAKKFAIKERCKDKKGWTYYKIELLD